VILILIGVYYIICISLNSGICMNML
jgi:hypothetical protein